jgi:hypothetical protein
MRSKMHVVAHRVAAAAGDGVGIASGIVLKDRLHNERFMGWPGLEPGRPFGLQIFAPLRLSPPHVTAFVVRTVP